MLAERLETLKALADAAAAPDFFCRNRENYGHANGLRRAVASMTGIEFQPLLTPPAWLDSGDAQSSTIEELREQLRQTTARHAEIIARINQETDRAERAVRSAGSALLTALDAISAAEKCCDRGAGGVEGDDNLGTGKQG